MAAAFSLLAARGIAVLDVSVARPTLDDVFLNETGRTLRDTGAERPGTAGTAAGPATAREGAAA
jgi:ABC-2 type transport system ATP-binding protein